jgi:hypothetical protein
MEMQEFGIDIVSDDNKTIVHHKVATKVFLVMNAQDAESVSRLGFSKSPMEDYRRCLSVSFPIATLRPSTAE